MQTFDRPTLLPLEARLALEWLTASGERTEARLRALVAHVCSTTSAIDADTREVIAEAAHMHALANVRDYH